MKNLLQLAAVATVVSLAAACGAMLDSSAANDDAAKSFDPIASYAQVKKLAGAYTSNVAAVSLSATRKAGAKSLSSGSGSFTWIWTVAGQDGIFVDVEVSASGATVLDHEKRALSAGQPTFEPAQVSVNGIDALSIAQASRMSGQPSDLYLVSNGPAPRWTIGYASGALSIDGESGDVVR